MPKTTDPDALGLRERKKFQTGMRIWRTAVALFVERGFDQVSVAEIAASAEVSKMTVFNYFPSKEDLVIRPLAEHVGEPAEVVRGRAAGQSAVAALREHFLGALAEFDPATGLCDEEEVVNVVRLITGTPSLAIRVHALSVESHRMLAAVLIEQDPAHDRLTAQVAAAQLLGARRTLVLENQRRTQAGEPAADLLPEATANAVRAFALVEHGLGDYCAGLPA
ncbi:TetR/AcrR family transcriptional regulator [Kitasatospora sp. NPDC004240]